MTLFYTDDGAGDPPLLFVHGYSCDAHDWSWQVPHFVGESMANNDQVLETLDSPDPIPVVKAMLGGVCYTPVSPPALKSWHMRRIAGMPAHVLRQTQKSFLQSMAFGPACAPYLAQRKCPVLSVYVDPTRAAVEAVLLTDTRSRVVIFEGSGHWVHQERPSEINYIIDTWLAALAVA